MVERSLSVSSMKRECVVLKFNPAREQAPRIVARGEGDLANWIEYLAKKNSVEVISDPELCATLYQLPGGVEIPENLYRAIAAIYRSLRKFDLPK